MIHLKKYQLLILYLILFLTTTKMEGQSDSNQNEKYLIIKEEYTITENKLAKFESSKQIKFPHEYREFLLKYNGGIPIPNSTDYSFPIERFYSLGDMELGEIDGQKEMEEHVEYDVENWFNHLDFKKLICIGVCERGNLHIYCGKEDYGVIYYSDYSGGEGLEKTGFSTFLELLENLKWYDDGENIEYSIDDEKFKNIIPNKVFTFDDLCYWKEDIKEQSLKRFKEVLDFYGHPNKEYTKYYSTGEEKIDVITHYINKPIILEYLLSIGGTLPIPIKDLSNIESLKILHRHNANLKGVLCSTRNLEIIKYLIIECNQDINESFKGEYPLINMTKIYDSYTDYGNIQRYERLLKIFDLGIDIDLSIKDDKGNTLKERIEIFKKEYEKSKKKYEEYQNRNKN